MIYLTQQQINTLIQTKIVKFSVGMTTAEIKLCGASDWNSSHVTLTIGGQFVTRSYTHFENSQEIDCFYFMGIKIYSKKRHYFDSRYFKNVVVDQVKEISGYPAIPKHVIKSVLNNPDKRISLEYWVFRDLKCEYNKKYEVITFWIDGKNVGSFCCNETITLYDSLLYQIKCILERE